MILLMFKLRVEGSRHRGGHFNKVMVFRRGRWSSRNILLIAPHAVQGANKIIDFVLDSGGTGGGIGLSGYAKVRPKRILSLRAIYDRK